MADIKLAMHGIISGGIDVPEAAYGDNLITHGGCESTDGWMHNGTGLASVAGGQSGNCLELTTGAATGYVRTATGYHPTLTAGKLYLFTAYVKSGTAGNGSSYLRIYDTTDSSFANSTAITSSGDWQQISMYYYAKHTGIHFLYGYKDFSNAGTILFDTFVIREMATHSVVVFTESATSTTYRYAAITAGNYATGALLATEAETQLDAAGGVAYTVTFDDSTGKVTITAASGTVTFYWTCASATQIGSLLGYDCTADDSGAISYTSDNHIFTTYTVAHTLTPSLPTNLGKKIESAVMADGTTRYAFYAGQRTWQLNWVHLTAAQLAVLVTLRSFNGRLYYQNNDESATWYTTVMTSFSYDVIDPTASTIYYVAAATLEETV